jgi:hypothetical protein
MLLLVTVTIPRAPITATDADVFFFSLILSTLAYITELLVRPDIGKTLFLHHLTTIFLVTAFITNL